MTLAAVFTATAGFPAELWSIQRFMQSPPPIEKLVYEVSLPERPEIPTSYHLVRWHTNGFFFRQTTNLANIEAPLQRPNSDKLCGTYGEVLWTLKPLNTNEVIFTVWRGDGRLPPPVNEVRNAVDHARNTELARVLNLGVIGVPIGAAEWEGDKFRYLDAEAHVLREGQLSYRDGRPARLDLVFHNREPKRPRNMPPAHYWQIEYDYGFGRVPAGLPSQISVFLLSTNQPPRPLYRYRIHELKEAKDGLAEPLLDPERFLGTLAVLRAAVSNTTRFVQTSDGQWTPMRRADDPTIYHPGQRNRWRWLYLFAAGLLLLAPAGVLVLWRVKERKRQERVERNEP